MICPPPSQVGSWLARRRAGRREVACRRQLAPINAPGLASKCGGPKKWSPPNGLQLLGCVDGVCPCASGCCKAAPIWAPGGRDGSGRAWRLIQLAGLIVERLAANSPLARRNSIWTLRAASQFLLSPSKASRFTPRRRKWHPWHCQSLIGFLSFVGAGRERVARRPPASPALEGPQWIIYIQFCSRRPWYIVRAGRSRLGVSLAPRGQAGQPIPSKLHCCLGSNG